MSTFLTRNSAWHSGRRLLLHSYRQVRSAALHFVCTEISVYQQAVLFSCTLCCRSAYQAAHPNPLLYLCIPCFTSASGVALPYPRWYTCMFGRTYTYSVVHTYPLSTSGSSVVHRCRVWQTRVLRCIYKCTVSCISLCFNAVLYNMWKYVEIKCQLDATDDIYCRFYCLLNTFRAPLCPSSEAREYYTDGRCLWYLVLRFSSCRYGVELRVMCPVCRLVPETCWASNKIWNKYHLLHLVGILFPHIPGSFNDHFNNWLHSINWWDNWWIQMEIM